MKRKMISAIIWAIILLIALLVFIGLYVDKSAEAQKTYREKYKQSLADATEELDTYFSRKIDYDLHYNMDISDLGSARSFVFLIDDYSERQKAINELHYCFVKYPKQMKTRLEAVNQGLKDIVDNLDKGYDEIREVVDSIEKKGE